MRDAIDGLSGFAAAHASPTFNELVVRTPVAAARIVDELAAAGISPGVPLSRWFDDRPRELLVTATELTTDQDIARLTEALAAYCGPP